MGAPKRMDDVDVDAGKTPHPLAEQGPIPEEHWIPMLPFDVSDWDDRPVPQYEGEPGSTEAQVRADIRASRKRAGLPPLPKEDVDALIARHADDYV